MHLTTPLQLEQLPEVSLVANAFTNLPKTNTRFLQLLMDLRATEQKDLWPGFNYVPKTKEGILFSAAKLVSTTSTTNDNEKTTKITHVVTPALKRKMWIRNYVIKKRKEENSGLVLSCTSC